MARRERPLDEGDSPLLRFAADLRLLRERAGRPTYRQLALRAHSSAASLSTAASGRKLPTLAVTSAYVRACGGDVKEWEARWRALAETLATGGSGSGHRPPYLGTAAYAPSDTDRFFGREQLVEELLARLRQDRIAVVVGASGTGKTSLVNAGAIARLRTEDPSGTIITCTPGPNPGHTVTRCLTLLDGARRAGGPEPLLVVDQWEELFTHCHSPAERARFLDALWTATLPGGPSCRMVLAIRADVHHRCATHPLLAATRHNDPLTVGPMTPEQLHRAITEPAARAGCTVEDRLLAVLVAGAAGQSGALPVLSSVLLATWRCGGNNLTSAGFHAVGGIEQTLARSAESAFAQLSDARRHRTKDVLLRLVEPDGGNSAPRAVAPGDLDDDPDARAVLEHFADARLLTLDRDRVTLAHTAVQHAWPRLAEWAAEDPEGLRCHRRLTEATGTWQASDRDPAVLYRGSRLAEARNRAAARDRRLTTGEREFLAAGVSAEATRLREEAAGRARLRAQRRLIAVLAALLMALSLLVALGGCLGGTAMDRGLPPCPAGTRIPCPTSPSR